MRASLCAAYKMATNFAYSPGQMLASEHIASHDSLEVTHQIRLTLKGSDLYRL